MSDNATLSNTDGGSSSPLSVGGLISTVEFQPTKPADTSPAGAQKAEGQKADQSQVPGDAGKDQSTVTDEAKAAETPSEGGEPKDSKKADEDRFDKHPRWQEMRTKVSAAEQRAIEAEKRFTALEERLNQMAPQDQAPAGKQSGSELAILKGMTNETLLDALAENPLETLASFAQQIRDSVTSSLAEQSEQAKAEAAVVKTLDAHKASHPDFDEKWTSGEIQRFMEQNPGHNALSAHLAMTIKAQAEAHQKALDEAVAKAAKDAEAKTLAAIKAKGHAASLGAGPAAIPPGGNNETLDTKQHGGMTAFLAARSLAREQQRGA